MELDRIIQHCLDELDGPAWIAKRVEVMPGVVDSEIIHITPEMDRLYGYVWPDTLVGRRISEIHTLTDAQITRQYALLRHLGFAAPQHYVMHGLHPNGRIFRIIKHVNQQAMGPITLWVTRHEKWYSSTPLSLLKPLGLQLPQHRDVGIFLGHSLRWYVRNVSTPGRHVNRRDQKFARGVKILDGGNQDSACGKKDLRDPEHARYSVFLSRTFPGLNTAAALPHGGKGDPPPLGCTQCPGGKNTPEHAASQHRQTIHQQCQTTRAQECRRLTIDEQL